MQIQRIHGARRIRFVRPEMPVDHIELPVARNRLLPLIERLKAALAFVDVERRGSELTERSAGVEERAEPRSVALERESRQLLIIVRRPQYFDRHGFRQRQEPAWFGARLQFSGYRFSEKPHERRSESGRYR